MHTPLLSFFWPLIYVVAAMVIGIGSERIWSCVLARRIEHRWSSLAVATSAVGIALFICIVLVGIYATVLAYAIPEHTLDFIRKVLLAMALAAITFVVGRFAYGLMGVYSRSAAGLFPKSSLLSTIAELLVFVVGGLIVLGSLGIEIAPILTALGVGGLAVGLALSAPLGNLFAGLQIIASRELRPGDYIKFDEGAVEGWVLDISWNNTTIRDRTDSLIVVPNSKVTATSFTNYDLPDSHLTIEIKATISPESDLDQAERLIHDCAVDALRACKVDSRFDPQVRFLELTDSRIEFVVFLRAETFVDQFKIRHEFVKRLHSRFLRDPKALPILPAA